MCLYNTPSQKAQKINLPSNICLTSRILTQDSWLRSNGWHWKNIVTKVQVGWLTYLLGRFLTWWIYISTEIKASIQASRKVRGGQCLLNSKIQMLWRAPKQTSCIIKQKSADSSGSRIRLQPRSNCWNSSLKNAPVCLSHSMSCQFIAMNQ